jgi:hypothetical protein
MNMLIALLTVLDFIFMTLISLNKILLGGLFDTERDNFYVFIEDSVHFFLLFHHQTLYNTILMHEELFQLLLVGHEVYIYRVFVFYVMPVLC